MTVFPEKYTKPELQGLSSAGGMGWHARCAGGGGPGTGPDCSAGPGPGPPNQCVSGSGPFGVSLFNKSSPERLLDPGAVSEGL